MTDPKKVRTSHNAVERVPTYCSFCLKDMKTTPRLLNISKNHYCSKECSTIGKLHFKSEKIIHVINEQILDLTYSKELIEDINKDCPIEDENVLLALKTIEERIISMFKTKYLIIKEELK